MIKYEVGQTWSNSEVAVTITNVATSHDYTYIRYELDGKTLECDSVAFERLTLKLVVGKETKVVVPVVPAKTAE